MIRFLILSVLLGSYSLCATVFGQHQESSSPQLWDVGIYRVPPGFVSSEERFLDVSLLLEKYEIPTPPGSEAWYDKETSRLFVKNTPENISLVESHIVACSLGSQPIDEIVEIRIFEYSSENTLPKKFTYADLKNLPSDKIRLIDRFSITTKSGNATSLIRLDSQIRSANQPRPVPSTKFKLSSQPDGVSAELEITGQINLRRYPGMAFSASKMLTVNEPAVLSVLNHPQTKGSTLVVAGILTRENHGGWRVQLPASSNQQPSP